MKTAIRICVIMFLIQSAFAAESPQLTISTNVIGPPQFRSYKLTKVYKRGQSEILRDMAEGPGKNAALRIQHVVHEGDVVYSVRETREGTIVTSTHGTAVSVLQIDVNRDGKSDVVLLLKGGEVSEAYLVEKDGFLSPVPSKVLFNEEGTKRHHETIVDDIRKLISQPAHP